jgi:hypothetical protein
LVLVYHLSLNTLKAYKATFNLWGFSICHMAGQSCPMGLPKVRQAVVYFLQFSTKRRIGGNNTRGSFLGYQVTFILRHFA